MATKIDNYAHLLSWNELKLQLLSNYTAVWYKDLITTGVTISMNADNNVLSFEIKAI